MNNLKTLLFSAGVAMAMFSACSSTEGKSTLTQSGLDAAAFDTVIGGKKVDLYTLTNANGKGIKIDADGTISFSALHYTDRDLWEALYDHDLDAIRRSEVVLTLDCRQRGLGNASCGPGPREKYEIKAGTHAFRFRISPM